MVKYRKRAIRFASGSPLGFLSCWNLFTLLHHLMVQQSAYFVTKELTWFPHYAILGDDLVIGDRLVALQYKRLLKRMKVKISVAKSLVSENNSLEFASRFIFRGTDLSPIYFKLLMAAKQSLPSIGLFFRRVREFREIRISEFIRVLGGGYRVLGLSAFCYSRLHKLPVRWFKVWLLIYNPAGSLPYSLVILVIR